MGAKAYLPIKKPQPYLQRLGFLPASNLHSPILEDLFVKDIQAGFLTLGSSYSLRLPTPILRHTQDSGQWLIASFVPEYSGGSVSDFFFSWKKQRSSLHLDITDLIAFI
jgi:hypothetical protein